MTHIVEEITAKSESLPPELQTEVLDFVDFIANKGRRSKTNGSPFQSVRDVLERDCRIWKKIWPRFAL
ncbi:MAG: DUF2281 domain-containing protein [Saprospiraceae bacterium]|nr:DUF2281 domain-containing protein [Pyrinomonadaceae bacterium]